MLTLIARGRVGFAAKAEFVSTAADVRFRRESERRLDVDAAEISMAASNDRPNTAALRTPENADLRDAEPVFGKPARKAVARPTP